MKVVTGLRASALPLAFRCAGSLQPSAEKVVPYNVAADDGHAGHEVMRRIVDMDLRSTDDVDVVGIARQFSVDEDDLKIQAFVGVRVWQAIREMFPTPHAEVRLRSEMALRDRRFVLTGQLDLFSVDKTVAHVADWKFGRLDGDHRHQLAAYSALVMLNYPNVQRVAAFAVWMRDGETEPYSMDRQQMDTWFDQLAEQVLDWDGVYRPGPHCVGCRRAHECPARLAMVRADVEMVEGAELAAQIERGLADVPDARVVELRRKAHTLTQVLYSLEQAIRMRVVQAGGKLDGGDGRELALSTVKKRRVDPLLGAPVLEKHLTDEEIAACMKISASKVDDAVAAKHDRGKKRDAIDRVDAELRAAGAVTIEEQQRLSERKKR